MVSTGTVEPELNNATFIGLSTSTSKTELDAVFNDPETDTDLTIYSNLSSQPSLEEESYNEILSPGFNVNGKITGSKVEVDHEGSDVDLNVIPLLA